MRKHAKGIHPGFETQSRCHQKSKTGVSTATQKGLMASFFFLEKIMASFFFLKKERPSKLWQMQESVQVTSYLVKGMRWWPVTDPRLFSVTGARSNTVFWNGFSRLIFSL